MEELIYYVIEEGQRIPEGVTIRKRVIDSEEIEECREDGESDEEVIRYLLSEEVNEASQAFCNALVLTEQQFKEVQAYGK